MLTQSFGDCGWDVTHMTFPNTLYTPKSMSRNVEEITTIRARFTLFPYIDKFMWWLPKRLYQVIRGINRLAVRKCLDWNNFDVIVLESGKPLFLVDVIPGNAFVVYRQSDSVKLALGKGQWYIAEEDSVYQRADLIVLKKKLYSKYIPSDYRNKIRVIENGLGFSQILSDVNPYLEKSRNAIYVGLHRLDVNTLKIILEKNPHIDFHLVGPCLGTIQGKLLRKKYANFFFHGFLERSSFLPMIKYADLAFFPFRRSESMKWYGLTSKYLHFMYFNLPIVSYPTGLPGEFDGLPVYFAKDAEEFSFLVSKALGLKPLHYNIDFENYSERSRLREYCRLVEEITEYCYAKQQMPNT
jgi:hypothetical protein